ncbi:MAG: hypothetical protein ACE5JJ_03255 [Nitrospinota bacterium]
MLVELLGIFIFLILYVLLFALEPWSCDLPARGRKEAWFDFSRGGGS